MRLLLDTHVLLPLIDERVDNLERSTRDVLQGANMLFASVVCLWEITIKVRLGKLPLKGPLSRLPQLVDSSGLNLLKIEASHVLAEVDPLPATRDPFDRLLLAQCQVENLRLVTLDRALVAHPPAWRPG